MQYMIYKLEHCRLPVGHILCITFKLEVFPYCFCLYTKCDMKRHIDLFVATIGVKEYNVGVCFAYCCAIISIYEHSYIDTSRCCRPLHLLNTKESFYPSIWRRGQ